jgi:signal transduction histidine kinase
MRIIQMENRKNDLVLIVDDNPNNIQVLATIMAEYGYELGIAQNAYEVYKFLAENTPVLILLDVEMPDIDGYEVCRTIKANSHYKDIPIIFLTVKNEIEDIIKGFDLGAVDYMTKPFNRKELISRVRTHIALKQSRDELEQKNIELERVLSAKEELEKERDMLVNDLRKHRDQLEMIVAERTKELVISNQNFIQIVESITEGFAVLDKEWRLRYINKHQLLPPEKTQNDLLDKNIWEVLPEAVGSFMYHEFHRAMAERVPVHFETPTTFDNSWYEITIYPFEDGICCFIRDITDKKKYEAELKRLSGLDLIGQMAAGISHEIRNPMTTVRGFLQLLNKNDDCAKYHDFFQLMIEELDRANSIITEFLSMGNSRSTDLQAMDLNAIIHDIAPLMMADAFNQGKYIQCETSEVPKLLLNRDEIRQLLLNLSRNGLEAMSHGQGLTIKTYQEDDCVVLAVVDKGKGIKPDVLEKLGTPFFTTKDNGTGLGLGICYAIAARHRAKIDIKTGSKGTTFFVRFER